MVQSAEINEELTEVYCKMAELCIKKQSYDEAIGYCNSAIEIKQYAKV